MIKIITDSTCDIPQSLLSQYQIEIIPSYIIWNGYQYIDRVTLQPEEFYRRIQTDPIRPTSSQATEASFAQSFRKAADEKADEVICITLSSQMSGTYQAALNASKAAPIPVHVVDSHGPTMMLGWQVLAAARAREAGQTVREILEKVEKIRSKIVLVVGMETLSYISLGGRIGDAAGWLGNLLSVKPIVSINRDSGRIEPVTLVRTHKSMLAGLFDTFKKKLSSLSSLHVAVLHGNDEPEAKLLADRVRTELKPVELLMNITGPVLGLHTGPGALALAGYSEVD